jgi:TonB family protein
VALEHYKTQVLLLHSEQSTLDVLSSGFNDRYSVHLATSGSEALNTLVDTPIHILVSAQDLPGMSGLEALREAKKRSPETIGILLAGTDKQDGLEALVGDQEVFQIVRGSITPEALLNLIEAATKRDRMATLFESANDQEANVDVPAAEHIVMETSENGSTIISDGTGQMPALEPQKIQIAPGVGMRNIDVLVLTKDEEFLATVKDSARGLHNVHHSVTPTQAEQVVRDNKVGVLVTDAAMVGSDVESLTQRLRKTTPRLVAIVAGRRDDGDMLMDLINRGHVYRFLLKPVSPGRARLAIEASVKHHLEAADTAFKPKPAAAAPTTPVQRKPKLQPKPQPVARTKPKLEAAPPVTPKAVQKPAKEKVRRRPQKIEPTFPEATINEPLNTDNLGAPFDDGNSFTDTMTDIAVSVGKSISEVTGSVSDSAQDIVKTSGEAAAGIAARIIAPLRNPKTLGIAGGVVAALATAAWLFTSMESTPDSVEPAELLATQPSGSTADEATPEATVAITPPVEQAPVAVRPAHQDLLDEARIARDAGELFTPANDNALELYMAALTAAPDDAIVNAEFNQVISQVVGVAESAMLANNIPEATAALNMIGRADPDNSRLAFLGAQLVQLQQREVTAQARIAIREGRLDDAEKLRAEARAMTSEDSADVILLTEEIATARNQKQAAEQIALANARLDAGDLMSPPNNNARYYFAMALDTDPQNLAAQQGLITVAGMLVLNARTAIDNGLLDQADDLLRDARVLDPTSNELIAAYTALGDARAAIVEAERKAEAERQAAIKAEAARQAELARQAEVARLAEIERQAELARQAEAARIAEIERQAEEARKAEAARVAEASRQAERARQAEVARLAEIERQAELARQAEITRQADLKRQAEAAKQAETDRILAARQQVEADEAARIAAEKDAAKAATVSRLGVGAATVTQTRTSSGSANRQAAVAATPPPPTRSATVTPEPEPTRSTGSSNATVSTTLAAAATTAASNVVQSNGSVASTTQTIPQARPATSTQANRVTSSSSFASSEPELIPVSRLTRTNYVAPKYPRAAHRRNVTGSVDVTFTITTDGRIRDLSVLESEPGETFDQAAMDAVEKWRFEPVIENGVAVEKRTAVRLAFTLQ